MDASREIRNIALVGFMGTGKSTVGRMTAEALQFSFLDTDDLIEARAGKTISAIFAEQGEPAFRALESGVVVELARRSRTVVSTGGGLVTVPGNLASLKAHALVVCLWASPEKIWERVSSQTHRPLLQGPNPLEKIRELLAARAPAYKEADVLLNTEFRSLEEVTKQVLHQFHVATSRRA